MSKAACFHLSQLRTSTSTGQVWVKSGVRQLPDSPSLEGGHNGRTQQTCYTDDCGAEYGLGQVRYKTAARLYPHLKVGTMAKLKKHVTQVIVASDYNCFTRRY